MMNTNGPPPLYGTDNYFKCIQNGQKFCMVVAKLSSNESLSWTSESEPWKLERNYIHRGLCLPPDKTSKENVIDHTITLITDQLSIENVTVNIDQIHCQRELSPIKAVDIVFLMLILIVFLFVIIGSLLDYKNKKGESILEKILLKFSVLPNWRKITQTEGNEDFNRLRCIQGLRALTNMGIIGIHSGLGIMTMYYYNTEALEKFFSSSFMEVYLINIVFYVHIFLMISTFLLANQLFSHHKKYGSFSFKDFLILITNRYFRLYILTLLFILFSQTTILDPFLGVPNMKLFNINRESCQEGWSRTVLFINNFFDVKDICYATTWYLAADFQAYILLTFITYVTLKYNLSPMKVMLLALITSMMIFGMVIYATDMKNIVYTSSFRDAQRNYLQDCYSYKIMYSSFYSTLPTSISGMIFGYLYFKTKEMNIKEIIKVYQTIWTLTCIGLPALSVYLCMFKYNKLSTAILGSMIKVLYTSGIAIGIIGMSFGFGGIVRQFLEGKYNIFLGNISFCAYLVNYTVMMLSGMGTTNLVTLNNFLIFRNLLKELFLSLLSGLILSITIEQPALSIQKMFLPQLRRHTIEPKKTG